jgi:hypothetical protein
MSPAKTAELTMILPQRALHSIQYIINLWAAPYSMLNPPYPPWDLSLSHLMSCINIITAGVVFNAQILSNLHQISLGSSSLAIYLILNTSTALSFRLLYFSLIDQITIKTTNHECRLYWCLTEFIDWRYSQLCCIFDPSCKLAPLPSLQFTSPPLLCVTKYRSIHYIQCVTGGGGGGLCRDHIHCVFDQIPNLQNYFSTSNKNLGGEEASDR